VQVEAYARWGGVVVVVVVVVVVMVVVMVVVGGSGGSGMAKRRAEGDRVTDRCTGTGTGGPAPCHPH
jgi:ABC-type transporter Mla subunit MlaD